MARVNRFSFFFRDDNCKDASPFVSGPSKDLRAADWDLVVQSGIFFALVLLSFRVCCDGTMAVGEQI